MLGRTSRSAAGLPGLNRNSTKRVREDRPTQPDLNLGARVIAVAGTHGEPLRLQRNLNLAKLARPARLVGRVSDAVLVAQLFFNLAINILDRMLLGDFEVASAGFLGHSLQDLLPIGPLGSRHGHPAAAA